MKSAFVHCRIFPGGALNVFKDLIQEKLSQFPQNIDSTKIFTLISDTQHLQIQDKKIHITTALPKRVNKIFLYFTKHKIPLLSQIFDYRNLIFFYPSLTKLLSKKIKKYKPEQIIISSFAISKNIDIPKGVKSELYLHSPIQYIRSHYDEYSQKIKGRKLFLFKAIVNKLKKRDQKYKKFDKCYANSNYTKQLAKKIYGIDCQVKYPKITKEFFDAGISFNPLNYYVYIGRLVNFVRESDLIIRLFNQLKLPLIIIGSGPDELYLKSIAGNGIIFTGRIQEVQEKIKIIQNSKGMINLTKESFGISTVEGLLLGVPIFGYNQGATTELVDKDSGILSDSKDIKILIEKFKEFDSILWDRKLISKKIKGKLNNNK